MSPRKKLWRFLTRIFIVVAVILLCIGGWAYFNLYLPIGEGPAGPTVQGEPFTETWSERPVLFVGIGDSITDGYGAYPPERSYFRRLINNPADEFDDMRGKCLSAVLPNLTSLNLAVSTTTSDHHEQVQLPQLQPQPDDVLGLIVMTTGGNDIIHNYGRSPPRENAMFGATWEQAQPWINNYRARLGRMLDAITAKFPGGCHIFLANIYDPTDGAGAPAAKWLGFPAWPDGMKIHAAYNQIIADACAARPNVHLVDIHTPMLGHGLRCRKFWDQHYDPDDPHFWYLMILEDPNHRGYDCIRRVFLNRMIKVLVSEEETPHP